MVVSINQNEILTLTLSKNKIEIKLCAGLKCWIRRNELQLVYFKLHGIPHVSKIYNYRLNKIWAGDELEPFIDSKQQIINKLEGEVTQVIIYVRDAYNKIHL